MANNVVNLDTCVKANPVTQVHAGHFVELYYLAPKVYHDLPPRASSQTFDMSTSPTLPVLEYRKIQLVSFCVLDDLSTPVPIGIMVSNPFCAKSLAIHELI